MIVADYHQASAAASVPLTPAVFDASAYPHLLSLILDNSDTPTLATLMRCSRGMLRVASPRLYRNLHLTPLQLQQMLQTGWSSRGAPKSFSASLLNCLQHTQTLHLQAYLHGLTYPKVPRGCFANCTRVILHVDEVIATYAFPSLFQSLASHLYILLSDATVLQHQSDQGQAVALLSGLPRSFTAVTFLVPHAYRFASAPSCAHTGTPPAHKPVISVVLLPWALRDESKVLQNSMGQRWFASARSRAVALHHDAATQYVGIEKFTATLELPENLLLLLPDLNGLGTALPTFTKFARWLLNLEGETVYTNREWNLLMLANCILAHEANKEYDRLLEQRLQDTSQLLLPPESVAQMARSMDRLQERKAAYGETEALIAQLKDHFTRDVNYELGSSLAHIL